MRITDNMISKSFLSNISQAREKMADVQTDLATTKKLRNPSDDPSGFLQATNFNNRIGRNEQFIRNIRQASARITDSMAVLDSAAGILTNAKDLATQSASETINAQTRKTLASEVEQMLNSLIAIGNTKHNGKFVFAGTKTTDQPPFQLENAIVSYHGNDGVIKIKIGEQIEIAVNKPGSAIFIPDEGVDVFNSLAALKQALEQNDTVSIQNVIDDLDTGIKNVVSITSELGIRANQLSLTEEFLEDRNIKLTEFSSHIEDTDMVEATINFQTAENAYTFALRSYSELIQTSLLNFIS